jgi:hypothetical protein
MLYAIVTELLAGFLCETLGCISTPGGYFIDAEAELIMQQIFKMMVCDKIIYLWGLNFIITLSWQKHPKLK